jgi:hypothetical protein
VTTEWTQFTIDFKDAVGFVQPSWAKPVPFNLAVLQKLQFKISADEENPVTGTLYIDDVEVHGYVWMPPTLCPIIGAPGTGTGALLGDLEGTMPTQNKYGEFWYAYNDAEGRTVTAGQFSEIFGGVKVNPLDPTEVDLFIQGNGQGGTNGAFIQFQLGPTYLEGTETIDPFVGVGTRLSDNLGLTYYNAAADGATGVYFEYQMTGGDFLKFEVKANQNFGKAGIMHHCLVPPTAAGVWQSVSVKFSELFLPDWKEVKLLTAAQKVLNTMALEKFQWAVQSDAGTKGTIAVDNVYLLGATAITPKAPVMRKSRSVPKLHAAAGEGTITVRYPFQRLKEATVQLINPTGQVLAAKPVYRVETSTFFETTGLASGIYMVRLKGMDSAGRQVALQRSIPYMK